VLLYVSKLAQENALKNSSSKMFCSSILFRLIVVHFVVRLVMKDASVNTSYIILAVCTYLTE
jgi:hypothetical protein